MYIDLFFYRTVFFGFLAFSTFFIEGMQKELSEIEALELQNKMLKLRLENAKLAENLSQIEGQASGMWSKPKVMTDESNNYQPKASRLQKAVTYQEYNHMDKAQRPAIIVAILNGNTARFRQLIAQGENIYLRKERGKATLLHVACSAVFTENNTNIAQNTADIAHELLNHGAELDARDKHGQTALFYAVRSGHYKAVEVLMKHGANKHDTDNAGLTPLDLLREHPNRYVQAVLEGKSTAPQKPSQAEINADLQRAIVLNESEQFNEALAQGADVNARFDEVESNAFAGNNSTPLHEACFHARLNMVELLLSRGASINAQNDDQDTPLHLLARGMAKNCSPLNSIAQLLLNKGAQTTARNRQGQTPYDVAVYSDTISLLPLLAPIHYQGGIERGMLTQKQTTDSSGNKGADVVKNFGDAALYQVPKIVDQFKHNK